MGRFLENKELILETGEGLEAHGLRFVEDAPQGASRTHRFVVIGKFTEDSAIDAAKAR